jgi:hypothetical protein
VIVAAPGAPEARGRRSARCWAVLSAVVCGLGLSLTAPAPAPAGGATPPRGPLESGTSTSAGSWVVLPMGQLTDPSNTFWQLLFASPGPSHWSVITPPGAADNGGLVAGTSGRSILVGVLPSDLLRFSPLSQSGDGGSSWNPEFLPGALAPVPDALSYLTGTAGGALAVDGRTRVLVAAPDSSAWTRLVSTARLGRVAPRCGVSAVDAVALLPDGAPLVATGCARGGIVGFFTRAAGSWQVSGPVLRGHLTGSSTSVLRLETGNSSATALVTASRRGRHSLVALWSSGATRWMQSAPLALGTGQRVLATAVGSDSTAAVLLRSAGGLVATDVSPGGAWIRLPKPPVGTVALAAADPPAGSGPPVLDAFTVHGSSLSVFSLTPSRSAWTIAQSSQVSLAYGSSS